MIHNTAVSEIMRWSGTDINHKNLVVRAYFDKLSTSLAR